MRKLNFWSLLIAGFAHKACDSDGNWFRHPMTNRTWTNYTTCIDVNDYEVKHKFNFLSQNISNSRQYVNICSCTMFMLQLRRHVNLIYVTGYTISLIAILLSISIFCYFRWVFILLPSANNLKRFSHRLATVPIITCRVRLTVKLPDSINAVFNQAAANWINLFSGWLVTSLPLRRMRKSWVNSITINMIRKNSFVRFLGISRKKKTIKVKHEGKSFSILLFCAAFVSGNKIFIQNICSIVKRKQTLCDVFDPDVKVGQECEGWTLWISTGQANSLCVSNTFIFVRRFAQRHG